MYETCSPANWVSGHPAKNAIPKSPESKETIAQSLVIPNISSRRSLTRRPPRNIPKDPTKIKPPEETEGFQYFQIHILRLREDFLNMINYVKYIYSTDYCFNL